MFPLHLLGVEACGRDMLQQPWCSVCISFNASAACLVSVLEALGGRRVQVTGLPRPGLLIGDTIEPPPLLPSRHSPQIGPLAGSKAPILQAHSRLPSLFELFYGAGKVVSQTGGMVAGGISG